MNSEASLSSNLKPPAPILEPVKAKPSPQPSSKRQMLNQPSPNTKAVKTDTAKVPLAAKNTPSQRRQAVAEPRQAEKVEPVVAAKLDTKPKAKGEPA